MQISVKFNRTTSFLQVDSTQSIQSLRKAISLACGMDVSPMMLLYNAKSLTDTDTVMSSGIQNLGTITVCGRVLGGGGNMSENDKAMAMKRNVAKICRRCYARLAPRAEVCRKKMCRGTDLRFKKLIKALKK